MCKISVIIPTYNRASHLKIALESVLEQSFKDFEVIVVDDHSDDNGQTKKVVDSFNDTRLRYYYLDNNNGPATARNFGVTKSKGELISFLDSDDRFMPNKLKDHIEIFEKYKYIAMVYSNEYIMSDKDAHSRLVQRNTKLQSGYIAREFFMDSFIATNTVTLKKSIFEEFGGFDEELIYNEDDDLWLRIMIKYKVFCSDYPCAIRFLHDSNMSSDRTKMVLYQYKGFTKLFKGETKFVADNIDIVEGRIKKIMYKYILWCIRRFKIPYKENISLYNKLMHECKSLKKGYFQDDKLHVVHCFNTYLNTSENWIYRTIRNLPNCEVIIIAKKYINELFWDKDFKYIIYPFGKCSDKNKQKAESYIFKAINKIITKLLDKKMFYLRRKLMTMTSNIDIIHCHFSVIGWNYRQFMKFYNNVPFVVSFYGYDYESLPFSYPIWKERYKILFNKVDAFICEGSFGANVLKERGCDESKIHVIPLGVIVNNVPFIKRTKLKEKLSLLQLARLTPKKGYKYTIEAFAQALKSCPNLSLTIVGEDTNEGVIEDVTEIINRYKIKDKVKILNYIDFNKLYDFMKEFDVFIHPSCYTDKRDCEGGAPIVILDAQATGMPVISTTHCDIPDEVIDMKTGYLTPEREVSQLVKSIEKFYNMDDSEYQVFSKNARKHIEKNYDSVKNSKRLEELYKELINRKKQI